MERQVDYRFLVDFDLEEGKGRARVRVKDMRSTVQARMARKEAGRLRIGGAAVRIGPDVAPDERSRMGRCLGPF
jgi:hypothetical protein